MISVTSLFNVSSRASESVVPCAQRGPVLVASYGLAKSPSWFLYRTGCWKNSYVLNWKVDWWVQSESPTSFEKVVDTSFEKKNFLLIFSMN